ncbi:MAG: hypothetical protein ABIG90_02345 [bacterium]
MVQAKKREKESVSSLIRRFTRRVQQSGLLLQSRQNRFYNKAKSKRQVKESALHRQKVVAEKERLRKLGKLEDEFSQKRTNY